MNAPVEKLKNGVCASLFADMYEMCHQREPESILTTTFCYHEERPTFKELRETLEKFYHTSVISKENNTLREVGVRSSFYIQELESLRVELEIARKLLMTNVLFDDPKGAVSSKGVMKWTQTHVLREKVFSMSLKDDTTTDARIRLRVGMLQYVNRLESSIFQ